MGIDAKVIDGKGSGDKARVTNEGYLGVIAQGIPPVIGENKVFPYRKFLTLANDGITKDMRVDGSVTNQRFFIQATEDEDTYVTNLSFIIADGGAVLREFGNIGALTNGCLLTWETLNKTLTIHDALVSNWEFVRLALGNPAFGTAASSFRANNVVGPSEAFLPIIDFSKLIPPWGLRLAKGTTEKIVLTVRDNVTTVDQFDAVAYGFTREE